MSLKIALIDADVLHADNALEPLHFQDGIYHQEGIAVRQDLLDAVGVQNHRFSSRSFRCRIYTPPDATIICETPHSG